MEIVAYLRNITRYADRYSDTDFKVTTFFDIEYLRNDTR